MNEKCSAVLIVGISLLLTLCCVAVNADVVYEMDVISALGAGTNFDYLPCTDGYGTSVFNRLVITDPAESENLVQFTIHIPAENVTTNEESAYLECDLLESGVAYGNLTVVYSWSADHSVCFYTILFENLDFASFGSNCQEFVVCDPGITVHNLRNCGGGLGEMCTVSGEITIGYLSGNYYCLGNDTVDLFFVNETYKFKNHFYLNDTSTSGLYSFNIIRENFADYSPNSKFFVFDSDVVYVNDTSFTAVNDDFLMVNVDPTGSMYINCVPLKGPDFWYNLTDWDVVPEPGYFDLSGLTKSTDGNLVSSVTVSVGSDSTYSDALGNYSLLNLETGSFLLNGSKSGYINKSIPCYIGSEGSYDHDMYLIPESALDTGEFGGVVYDFCDKQPVPGALVYLINVSAAGDETYTYSNDYGFYKFEDLIETCNYSIRASKLNYEQSVIYEFAFNETTAKTRDIPLVPVDGCPDGEGLPVAPTPTPTPSGDETPIVGGIRLIFDLFGLGKYMTFIFALGVIAVMGLSFGSVAHGDSMAIAIGAFFGFIIDVALGWLPLYLVAVVICGTVYFIVKRMGSG